MKLKLTNEVKSVIQRAVELLKNGASRRTFMASVVLQMGHGGQRQHRLNWVGIVVLFEKACMSCKAESLVWMPLANEVERDMRIICRVWRKIFVR